MIDPELRALMLEFDKEHSMFDKLVVDDNLDTAFLVAHTMDRQIELIMQRLNRIKWPLRDDDEDQRRRAT